MSFHALDSDKVIIHTRDCQSSIMCVERDYYTTDGFMTSPRLLRENTRNCLFAHSTPLFEAGADEVHNDRIICIVLGYSIWAKDYRLVVSDSFFQGGNEFEPMLEGGRTVQGIIKMAVVKGFLVAAAKAESTDELALYVTKNARDWHRAEFPSDHRLNEGAYTILESTNYSIQVDVMTTKSTNPMGVLFTSNSNGTYFTRNIEFTNRNEDGNVDFEKIQGIQGIVLVNVVSNHEEVQRSSRVRKKVQTKISFDDGRTFKPITLDKEELHLHSVSGISNLGRIFSSPAPGLVMGVGNTGEYLKEYTDGNLYVSDDAGLTWRLGLKEAHKYEFGDQGSLLVAIYDEGETSEISYSIDHGHTWETADLEKKVRAKILTTTPDSTSLKFVLLASAGEGHGLKNYVLSIDFAGLHERKCGKDDFEQWPARLDEDGNPDCLMGQKQFYRRRLADKDCFVKEKFEEPDPEFESCKCSKEDFECDYNFVRNKDMECVPSGGKLPIPKGECKDPKGTFMGSSGWRLIPGNKCDRTSGDHDIDAPKRWPCEEHVTSPPSGKVTSEKSSFPGNSFEEHYYLERTDTSKGDDQTVVMRTSEKEIYLSKDHGKKWERILKDETITAIYPHDYFNDVVFFLTGGRTVWYSINRGERIEKFEAPAGGPTIDDGLQPLGFHSGSKDLLIWTAAADCAGSDKGRCHSDVYYSKDRGDNWDRIARYGRKCEFIKEEGRAERENLVYCAKYQDENLDNPLKLVSSDDWFLKETTHFPDIIDFATMAEFIIVAAKDKEDLKVSASVDGQTFADALFPSNFKMPHETAYTVLDSSTHAAFLHVTVENRKDFEYGSILKSNSNGTFYVLSINGVNRDHSGYVDFEKMLGLQGVALVNVVDNTDQVKDGRSKKLKSMITHNDGAAWSRIPAPQKDRDGHNYDCDVKDLEKCSLHLHGYTERKDPRNTFSSPSAVGLMMGVGNVGEHLTRKSEGSLFITADGGITWQAVKKGNYMWEYGDQGSIIVIVQEQVATNIVYYSRDEGKNWIEYKFSDEKMIIEGISTLPSDTSRNFLLWGKDAESGSKIATVNLDFTGLTDKQCKIDEENPDDPKNDYYLWSPKHPLQKDNCLFGHIAQYHRKRVDRDCYNGRSLNKQVHNELKICDCTREDFECDYNYETASDGSCQLVPGLEPPDHSKACARDPKKISYFEPTGYRKIPLSQCQGGKELEFTGTERPCPGHDKDFAERHRGLSGFWLFVVAFLFPVAVATAVGYWVWKNWGQQFGRIKLGAEPGGTFDTDNPWISYPIMAISALVAVMAAAPLLVSSLWRSARGAWGGGRRYTTRSSFARGRGDYAVVDPDEDELLGVEDDDDF
jgi:photosystem II stability/assembly factor-like uncharacterized protein